MKLLSAFRNSPDTRKRRLGRLPLPPDTNGAEKPAPRLVGEVDAFVDALCDLPLAEWLVIGHAVIADRVGATARVVAFSRVEAALASLGLQITAWHVRDAVDTAAFTATSGIGTWTRANRRAFAAAHAAAEDAALALLADGALSTTDRTALTAPFTALDSFPAPDRPRARSM